MHTYSPTASHDAVVEFDNGDIGNQTNLNNAVRALGNRTELAKVTNDSQASAIATLQSQMASAFWPAVLDLTPTISATGDGGSYTGGENVFAFTKNHLSGTDGVATGLDTVTYTGSGGGTKLIRLGAGQRYVLDMNIIIAAAGGAGLTKEVWGEMVVVTATNTAVSSGVTTVRTIRGLPGAAADQSPAPDGFGVLFAQSVLLRNTTAAPLYVRLNIEQPLNLQTYSVFQGNILVRHLGPVAV